MPLRIVLDAEACEGYARCVAAAPELLRLGDDLPVTILTDRPAEALWQKAEAAVRACPRAALTMVEE